MCNSICRHVHVHMYNSICIESKGNLKKWMDLVLCQDEYFRCYVGSDYNIDFIMCDCD